MRNSGGEARHPPIQLTLIVSVLTLVTLQRVAVTVVDCPAVALSLIVPMSPLIVSTVVSAGFQVTSVATSTPDELPTVAVASKVIVSPGPVVVGDALMFRLLTTGHTVTVEVVVAVTDPSLALIVVVPIFVALDAALTNPLVCPTPATDESDEDHTDLDVTFSWLPSLKVPVAVI